MTVNQTTANWRASHTAQSGAHLSGARSGAEDTRPIVQTVDLQKSFGLKGPNPVHVLKGVNMEARAGEFVAIIGQSGSGKSTLLNLLGALDTPTQGHIYIAGTDIATLDRNGLALLRGRSIGFIFQFHYLLEEFTCLENALMPLTIRKGTPDRDDVAHAKALLARVGLADHLHKRPGQLSGGQQQRNSIVRALVTRPRLVLADEPTGNLDSRSGQEVFALMREMNRETGVAFVMITHDDRMARAADRILCMEDGLLRAADIVPDNSGLHNTALHNIAPGNPANISGRLPDAPPFPTPNPDQKESQP